MTLTLIPIHRTPTMIESYTLQINPQHCRGCKSNHETSEWFANTMIRSGMTSERLRHPDEVKYNLPVRIVRAQVNITAFCHDCYQKGALDHLPRPIRPQAPPPPQSHSNILYPHTPPKPPKSERAAARRTKSDPNNIDDL